MNEQLPCDCVPFPWIADQPHTLLPQLRHRGIKVVDPHRHEVATIPGNPKASSHRPFLAFRGDELDHRLREPKNRIAAWRAGRFAATSDFNVENFLVLRDRIFKIRNSDDSVVYPWEYLIILNVRCLP